MVDKKKKKKKGKIDNNKILIIKMEDYIWIKLSLREAKRSLFKKCLSSNPSKGGSGYLADLDFTR